MKSNYGKVSEIYDIILCVFVASQYTAKGDCKGLVDSFQRTIIKKKDVRKHKIFKKSPKSSNYWLQNLQTS